MPDNTKRYDRNSPDRSGLDTLRLKNECDNSGMTCNFYSTEVEIVSLLYQSERETNACRQYESTPIKHAFDDIPGINNIRITIGAVKV